MQKTDNYVFSSVFITLLTLATLFSTLNIKATFILYGLIMICVTLRSISDNEKNFHSYLMPVLTGLFAVLSGNLHAFTIIYESGFRKKIRLFLPSSAYLLYSLFSGIGNLPLLIFRLLILAAEAFLLFTAETIILRYYEARKSIPKAVGITALSEMYTKKLNQELVIKNFLSDRNARLEERENISRSIHNSVGHSITAAIVTLEAAEMLFDKSPEKACEKIITARERIRSGLDSIRHAVRVLDNEAVSISLGDFLSGINTAADEFVMDTMRVIHRDVPEDNNDLFIPREHTEFLTGAFQEILSNGVKHGNADVFFLHITADSTHIKLTVNDNGTSDFSAINSSARLRDGFGLKKIRSYANKCGGSASFSNDNGFKTEITLPFEGGTNEHDKDSAC